MQTPEKNEPKRAETTAIINGKEVTIAERKPGRLADPDGTISADTQQHVQAFFTRIEAAQEPPKDREHE